VPLFAKSRCTSWHNKLTETEVKKLGIKKSQTAQRVQPTNKCIPPNIVSCLALTGSVSIIVWVLNAGPCRTWICQRGECTSMLTYSLTCTTLNRQMSSPFYTIAVHKAICVPMGSSMKQPCRSQLGMNKNHAPNSLYSCQMEHVYLSRTTAHSPTSTFCRMRFTMSHMGEEVSKDGLPFAYIGPITQYLRK
jgi:hypothetical protein